MSDLRPISATVLVADDEECVLNLTRIVLKKQGYNVLTASNAREALRIAREHAGDIDLLLTDMRMPGMDGAMLSAEFKNPHPNSRVVCMTACLPSEVEQKFPDVAVLFKPFCPNSLCDAVKDSLVRCV